ncbi:MAG: hypothetical protein V1908_02150, partial [Candidatus Peregrinibacteria bacterium]
MQRILTYPVATSQAQDGTNNPISLSALKHFLVNMLRNTPLVLPGETPFPHFSKMVPFLPCFGIKTDT